MSRKSSDHEYLTDAEFRAWHGSIEFVGAALRAIDESLARAHGISVKEFDVLITLYNAPDHRLRMTALAENVLLTPSGLTHLVARLERAGFVARTVDPADRRSFFAELTDAGMDRLREARHTHNEVVRARLTSRLTAAELRTLGDLWHKIADH